MNRTPQSSKSYLSKETATDASNQLQTIGIAFLRHQAASGRKRFINRHKLKLLRAEDDQIFGQPAQMNADHRGPKQEVG